jgi:hypothetical protein
VAGSTREKQKKGRKYDDEHNVLSLQKSKGIKLFGES